MWKQGVPLSSFGVRRCHDLLKELFAYLDGEYNLDRAIELIQQNSRHYAKRQLTWFRRDNEIHWLNANDDYEKNSDSIDGLLRALVACKKNSVSFSYSPSSPKAGETVTFYNHSESGEDWSWSFGDGATSAIKAPAHVYKQPGTSYQGH